MSDLEARLLEATEWLESLKGTWPTGKWAEVLLRRLGELERERDHWRRRYRVHRLGYGYHISRSIRKSRERANRAANRAKPTTETPP